MSASCDVTRRTLSLGARDAYTGHCAKVLAETTVKGILRPKGYSYNGLYAKYQNTLFTKAPFSVDDEVVFAGKYYHVDAVEEEWSGNVFEFYQCGLSKADPHVDRPATSGAWHTDSQAITTDVAYRQKTWVNYYLELLSFDVVAMMDEPDYQLRRELIDNDVDALVFVTASDSTPIHGIDKKPYAFEESAVLKLRTTDKGSTSGRNTIDQLTEAIKHIFTDHPLGSIRQIDVTRRPEPEDMGGGFKLYKTDIALRYKRANNDYTPTLPSLTYSTISGGPYTFIFPNVVALSLPNINNDLFMQIPGRLGNIPQALGSESIEIQLTCDLDMQPWSGDVADTRLSWLRPQTVGTKTDASSFQVFLDIMHSAAQTEPYMILTLDWGSFNVRLTRMEPSFDGENNRLTLTFKEYNDTEASTNYKTRWGIP